MPIASSRIQYRTREPYSWPVRKYRLAEGEARRRIDLAVLTAEAAIWIDGSRTRHELRFSDRVGLSTGATPLVVLGYDERRRRQLFP